MVDKIIIEGLGKSLDGTYEVDLLQLVQPGFPESLTGSEMHYVKVKSGVRGAELLDALGAFDNDLVLALAAIVARRAGKRFDDEKLWDAAWGAVLVDTSERTAAQEAEEEDDANPPEAPPSGRQQNEGTEQPSTSGGESSPKTSENQENGQSRTGLPASARSAISDQVISPI